MSDESMSFDVVIVGAGPAGLAAAIRLKQLNAQLSVCVLEKGSEVGAHILSGAVFEPRALNELLPDWPNRNAPLLTSVTADKFWYLTTQRAINLPVPTTLHNQGNYIISAGNLCRWLAEQASELGVEIFPGFPAASCVYGPQGEVIGVRTADMGLDKSSQATARHQPGMNLLARYTLIAEGTRGSLAKVIMARYHLRQHCTAQTFGLGLKELWQVDPSQHRPGEVLHTIGWPLDTHTYGGGFIYHLENNQVAVGLIVGLDYQNPYLDPFQELQRFKQHPALLPQFTNAKRLAYGARAITEGGWQALPQLDFPGGLLIGDSAGFLNVPKIKGNHTAMKSGMLAAETLVAAMQNQQPLTQYRQRIQDSWLGQELYRVRNIRPAFRYGLWAGLAYAAVDTYLLRGKAPWTFTYQPDHLSLIPARQCQPIDYPKPDNVVSFDKLSSVYLTNTHHREDQPCHLQLYKPELAMSINWQKYASPESRYCPAQVYEIIQSEDKAPYLQINAQNCIHCKTCDIKDPQQNINWVPPEGGDGPNYAGM